MNTRKAKVSLFGAWCAVAAFLFLPVVSRVVAGADFGDSLYIDYSSKVDPKRLVVATTSVIHAGAKTDLRLAHDAGCKVLAYLSVVEVAPDAPYKKKFQELKIPVLGKNSTWDSELPDISSEKWAGLIFGLAEEAVAKGFDGFFLDTVDSVDLLAEKHPGKAEQYREALVEIIVGLRKKYPEKAIVSNRGFSIFDRIAPSIDGVLVESMFQTYFFDKKKYGEVPRADRAWIAEKLGGAKKKGLAVFVVDYVDPKEKELAKETAEKIRGEGFIPFVTTPELFGAMLAPIRVVPRKIAAIYGRQVDTASGGARYWPADTWTAQFLQLPIEWLGYEVDYIDAAAGELAPLDDSYAAILLDALSDWTLEVQKSVLQWLLAEEQKKKPLLVFGKIPFEGRYAIAFGKMLGMQVDPRTARTLNLPADLRVADSPVMRGEMPLRMIPYNYPSIVAPKGADILVGASFTVPGKPEKYPYDAVFLAPWGAVALLPFLNFERPDNISLWGIDPFAFIEQAIHGKFFPAPDATTRDGLRLFFCHIDGDGFGNRSAVEAGKFSSEVIRDEIYKKYPLPITSSVIEAELRGFLKYQKEGDSEKLKEIAKDIFSLPNIQVASHTFTHPFFWMKDDKTMTLYEEQSLEMGDEYSFNRVDPERQIRGSVDYVRKELAPPDKPVDLILWSGNCRPGPESVAIADEMGIENMNGGDTAITRARPSISAVAPLSMQWGDRLQVYAAVQNEMLFTNGFHGPRWGGYANVVQTFEKTESPRRLKAANIYFHMFIGDRLESLNSLRTVFDWVMGQKLQATTAVEYVRVVRQTHDAQVYEKDGGGWILVHGPDLRTFRLPESVGQVDFDASKNLIGWNLHEGQMYVAAGKSPRSELFVSASPKPHLYLESSTAEAEVTRFEKRAIELKAEDFRPVTVVLAGLAPDAECSVLLNGEAKKLKTDSAGKLVVAGGETMRLLVEDAPLP